MNALSFRRPERAEEIAALHIASWRKWYRGIQSDSFLDGDAEKMLLEKWSKRLADFDEALHFMTGAYAGTALCGFAYALKTTDPMEGIFLDNLHVAPDLVRQGIGRQLISRTAGWAVENHPDLPLHLEAYEDNKPAVAAYERLGGRVFRTFHEIAPYNRKANNLCFIWDDPRVLI